MKILIASQNPVKINATKEAFLHYFQDITVEPQIVKIPIPHQPVGEETFKGAELRANALHGPADYYVGIEGGIVQTYNKWFCFGVMCIKDKRNRVGFGQTPHFELPQHVIQKVFAGEELGIVMDTLQQQVDSKRGAGAIGYFTQGIMSRTQLYVPGLIVALIPLLHKDFREVATF